MAFFAKGRAAGSVATDELLFGKQQGLNPKATAPACRSGEWNTNKGMQVAWLSNQPGGLPPGFTAPIEIPTKAQHHCQSSKSTRRGSYSPRHHRCELRGDELAHNHRPSPTGVLFIALRSSNFVNPDKIAPYKPRDNENGHTGARLAVCCSALRCCCSAPLAVAAAELLAFSSCSFLCNPLAKKSQSLGNS
jgi:hypothetical protein